MSETKSCGNCQHEKRAAVKGSPCWGCTNEYCNWEAKSDAQSAETEPEIRTAGNDNRVADPVDTSNAGDNRSVPAVEDVTWKSAGGEFGSAQPENTAAVGSFVHVIKRNICADCKFEKLPGNAAPCDLCDAKGNRWEPKTEEPQTPTAVGFSREDLAAFIKKETAGINGLFAYKNQDYGEAQDAFANFRKSAQRIIIPAFASRGVEITEREAMFMVAQVLQDKHLVALSQTGINGNEVGERLSDIANYSLIQKAILLHG